MSTLFCRIFYRLLRNPSRIIWIFLGLSLLALAPIYTLKVNTSLLDLYPKDSPARIVSSQFQQQFGSLQSLDLVIKCQDSLQCSTYTPIILNKLQTLQGLNLLEAHPKIHDLGHYKWLYASLQDLDTLLHQIQNQKARIENPLLADLLPQWDRSSLDQMLKRSKINAQEWLGNPSGSIRIIHLYPKHDPADPLANSKWVQDVESLIQLQAPGINIALSGPIYHSAQSDAQAIQGLEKMTLISLGLVGFFLLLFFYRMPLFPLVVLVPILSAALWSLGIWSLFKGEIHILVLMLAPLALSMGIDSSIHLLSRYEEERRKGLAGLLSLETVLLETGPSLCRSNWTTALGFLSLALIPFPGIREFGLASGLFILMLWLNNVLFFPALMLKGHAWNILKIRATRLQNLVQFERLKAPGWKLPSIVLATTALAFMPISSHPIFDRQINSHNNIHNWADSCNQVWGQSLDQASYIRVNNTAELNKIQNILQYKLDSSGLGGDVYTQYQLLPSHQQQKLQLLKELQAELNMDMIHQFPAELQKWALEFKSASFTDTLNLQQLPQMLGLPNQQSLGNYVFFTPAISLSSLDDLRNFYRSTSLIQTELGQDYYSGGSPILLAEYVRLTMPYVNQAFWVILAGIVLLLLVEYRNPVYILMLIVPSALGALFTISVLKFFQTPFHAFNIYLVPLYLGISLDASILLLGRYLEEGRGSLNFVFRRTFPSIAKSALIALASFSVFLLSPSPIFSELGTIGIAAICASLISALLVQPLFLILVDRKRWAEYLQSKRA